MNIGNRIKQRRKELGMSAETLAEKIGKSAATVYRYEKGDIAKVDSEIILPIADALFTTPAYLMGWETEPIENKQTIIRIPKTEQARAVSGWIDDLPEDRRIQLQNMVLAVIQSFPEFHK